MGAISLEERTIHRRVSSSMVDIVLAEMDPGHTHHRSTCPDGQFWLSISGIQVVSGPRGTLRQNPFDLMYYHPREPAMRTTSDRTLAYGVRLRLSELRDHERAEGWVQGQEFDWRTKRTVIRLIHGALKGGSDSHELDEAVSEWIAGTHVGRPENQKTRWMAQVEDLLHQAPDLTLVELSRLVGLAPAYVSAQYSQIHGHSISHRRRQIMLERVLRLASKRTLNEAAIEAGFYDASHFHRACVAELGVRPSELKKLVRPFQAGIPAIHR